MIGGRYPLVSYTEEEELANRITHGAGALLSLAGLFLLVFLTRRQGDPWLLFSCAVYGTTLVLFYTFSTIYHTVRHPRVKYLYRILDHASIFLLIAGTYTPFTIVSLHGAWGRSLFVTIWTLAFAGVAIKIVLTGSLPVLMTTFYLAMGWLVVTAIDPLMTAVGIEGMALLLAGGMAYTFGLVFYAWKRLPYGHAIWHLFVLAGSALHYMAVLFHVVPRG